MAGLYLDEDVRLAIVPDLQDAGHAVSTYRDHGLVGASDALHLLAAARHGRTMVTCNRRDFRLLHEAWDAWSGEWGIVRPHPGIIVPDQRLLLTSRAATILELLSSGVPLPGRFYEWTGGLAGRWYRYDTDGLRRPV